MVSEFQQVFTQIFGEEVDITLLSFTQPTHKHDDFFQLPSGMICESCSTNLRQIVEFKKKIQTLRLGSELQTYIKLEDVLEDDQDIQDAFSDPIAESLEDPSPKIIVRSPTTTGKRTKVESVMQKYGAKFVEDATGEDKKTPKVLCPLCDKILTVTAFRVHIQRHEGTMQLPFMCEVCSKKFPSNAEFVIHKRTHTKEKVTDHSMY